MTQLIKLTEITKDNTGVVERPLLINPAFVMGVSEGELTEAGPHIIGETKPRTLRLIQLSAGRPVFVQETIDEILTAIQTP